MECVEVVVGIPDAGFGDFCEALEMDAASSDMALAVPRVDVGE